MKKEKKEVTLHYGNRRITFNEDYFKVPEDYTNLYFYTLGFSFGLCIVMVGVAVLLSYYSLVFPITVFIPILSAWYFADVINKKKYDNYSILKILPCSFYYGMFSWFILIKNWVKQRIKK